MGPDPVGHCRPNVIFFDFNATSSIDPLKICSPPRYILLLPKDTLKFIKYLFDNDLINVGYKALKHSQEYVVPGEKGKVQGVETQAQAEADRISAAVRHTHFNSDYVQRVRQSLMNGHSDRSLFISNKDYHILAISFYNCRHQRFWSI